VSNDSSLNDGIDNEIFPYYKKSVNVAVFQYLIASIKTQFVIYNCIHYMCTDNNEDSQIFIVGVEVKFIRTVESAVIYICFVLSFSAFTYFTC
jgi:hypothetical protein